jgi:hypothetical protein
MPAVGGPKSGGRAGFAIHPSISILEQLPAILT